MKHGIELNGVANLTILINQLKETVADKQNGWDEACLAITVSTMQEQLNLLERYMIAYAIAVENNSRPPYWHEVRENRHLFPTNRERFSK